jgi:hypothetical protein
MPFLLGAAPPMLLAQCYKLFWLLFPSPSAFLTADFAPTSSRPGDLAVSLEHPTSVLALLQCLKTRPVSAHINLWNDHTPERPLRCPNRFDAQFVWPGRASVTPACNSKRQQLLSAFLPRVGIHIPRYPGRFSWRVGGDLRSSIWDSFFLL